MVNYAQNFSVLPLLMFNKFVISADRMNDIDAIMKEALTYIRHSATLFHSYASALGKAGRYGESEKNFLKALELETNNANLYANLGGLNNSKMLFIKKYILLS